VIYTNFDLKSIPYKSLPYFLLLKWMIKLLEITFEPCRLITLAVISKIPLEFFNLLDFLKEWRCWKGVKIFVPAILCSYKKEKF
jgi:hypothetical protein